LGFPDIPHLEPYGKSRGVFYRAEIVRKTRLGVHNNEPNPFRGTVSPRGPEKQLVTLSVGPNGVELGALDAGPLVQQTWGRDYYEFWVDVPADEIHNLLFALLRERYAGRNDAVDEFRTFCEKEGIKHEWGSWP
jgi:hypothetical protein